MAHTDPQPITASDIALSLAQLRDEEVTELLGPYAYRRVTAIARAHPTVGQWDRRVEDEGGVTAAADRLYVEQQPHPAWCAVDAIDAEGRLSYHLGELRTVAGRTSDAPSIDLRLLTVADAMEPRGYGSTSLELVLDPGDGFTDDSPVTGVMGLQQAAQLLHDLTDVLDRVLLEQIDPHASGGQRGSEA